MEGGREGRWGGGGEGVGNPRYTICADLRSTFVYDLVCILFTVCLFVSDNKIWVVHSLLYKTH